MEEAGLFRKITSRPTCYLFLFNDVLIITKKKRWDTAGSLGRGCRELAGTGQP